MKQTKYIRSEGTRGVCAHCKRERDLLIPVVGVPGGAGPMTVGMEPMRWYKRAPVVSRHLPWVEEITSKGSHPKGFCPGSLLEPLPRLEPVQHNHPTRDIKPLGKCPACDEYHSRVEQRRSR